MEEITEKKQCTSCGACRCVCPVNAITMKEDEYGFLYPFVDSRICINCKKCSTICPGNKDNHGDKSIEVFAYRASDDSILLNSTSGGVFTLLSDSILKNNGLVYGVCYDEKLMPVYTVAKTTEDRDCFRGAKYVQADTRSIFIEVKNSLDSGKQVMFVGNPCVVSGLKAYLTKSYSNLLTVDIVCNGVPSRGVWREYLRFLNKKYGEIISYKFRDKSIGWHGAKLEIINSNNEIIRNNRLTQSFVDLCFSKFTLREACKNCKYKSVHRQGDITIGDFWGYDEYDDSFKDEKGISLVLVNNTKGKKFLEDNSLMKSGTWIKSSIVDIPQTNINKDGIPSPDSTLFWQEYLHKGYLFVARKYTNYGMKNNTINSAKRIIKQILNK